MISTDAQGAGLDPLAKIIRQVPRQCFNKSPTKSFGFLIRDLALIGVLATGIVFVHSWFLALPLSLLLGCALTGLFVLSHDAGHGAFSRSKAVNRFVGHLTSSPVLWPYDVWRLTHDVHHRWTHHADKDVAWKPLTLVEYGALPRWKRAIYAGSRSTTFFLASALFQYFYILDAKKGVFFDPEDARDLKYSMRLTLVVGITYVATAALVGGWYGLVFLFLIPQLVYHFWLSTFTLLHHTSPDNRFMASDEWSAEQAQLAMSVKVHFPRWVDWLTHDISWHVPHHVSVGIPHYHLREAHDALKQAYPDVVQEYPLSLRYVRAVIDQCHLVRSTRRGELGWLRVRDAEADLPVATATRT